MSVTVSDLTLKYNVSGRGFASVTVSDIEIHCLVEAL